MLALLLRLCPALCLSGMLAGLACGGLEFALVAGRVGPFLPTGPLRLGGYLAGLYGLTGALAGLVLGVVVALLECGDLGRARRGDKDEGRVIAYASLALIGLAAVGLATRQIVEAALVQFHHRPLIAALSGAGAAGVALGWLVLVLLLGPLVSRAVPVGPRLGASFRSPLLILPTLVVGLYLGAAFVAAHVFFLEQRPRMNHPVRALNAALAAPFAIAAGLGLAWLGYRALARSRVASLPATFGRVVLTTVLVLLAPPAIAAALTWSTTRQLDLRPFVIGGGILFGLVVCYAPLRARRNALASAVLLGLCVALVFGLGRVPRVRKASALAGLAPHLTRAIQWAADLDGDGYASVLGGGDCNDLDRRVHPGAFDWPDDGIDQDCNGHEATLTPRRTSRGIAVPSSVPEKPNVLLITLDALRADHVSSYGYERRTTPRLDELAKDGVRFENAWAHAPSTRYSVPAILSGRYPSTIAVNNDAHVHWPPQVLPENRMLAEIMKDLGYRTAATLSYHYFERGWGLDQGFDDYDYHLYTLHSVGGDPSATSGSSSRQLADLDIEWLKSHAGQPFFLWSHFYDTHFRFERHPDLPESNFGSDELSLYDGEIRYTDHQVGRVFDTLRELGLWDKTIIIVTADHGDGFGEHGIPVSRRHGYHLYRTETKVPILIRVPGLAPRIVDTPIGHVDLIPTLLDLLRRPASEEPQLLGDSLVAAMLGDESAKDDRTIYQEVWYEGPTSKKALVSRRWHLIRNLVPEDTSELYDLSRDPGEDHDLSGLGEPAEERLAAILGERTDELAIPPGFAAHLKDAVSPTPTHPQSPLGDELSDLMRVVGADVEPGSIKPGATATVTVHFEVRKNIPDGWIVFTHAIGPGGRSMNLDHAPVGGLLPLSAIEAGRFVQDPIRISFPANWPAGPTRLELGLYKRGSRAPARGAHSKDGAVTVATIVVTP